MGFWRAPFGQILEFLYIGGFEGLNIQIVKFVLIIIQNINSGQNAITHSSFPIRAFSLDLSHCNDNNGGNTTANGGERRWTPEIPSSLSILFLLVSISNSLSIFSNLSFFFYLIHVLFSVLLFHSRFDFCFFVSFMIWFLFCYLIHDLIYESDLCYSLDVDLFLHYSYHLCFMIFCVFTWFLMDTTIKLVFI